jgi:hypothetical protein
MNYTNKQSYGYRVISPQEMKNMREFAQQVKSDSVKHSIPQKLIEIDNFRKVKKEVLKGDASPIVKGYLANDIENRIEEIKREITDMIGGY